MVLAVKFNAPPVHTGLLLPAVGAEGIVLGDAMPEPLALGHPLTVCVTEYVPPVVTEMEVVVAPVFHDNAPV